MAFDIEKAAEHGFHLVVDGAEKVFERVTATGTQSVKAASTEDALAEIESRVTRNPGLFSDTITRSDGASELRDDLEAQSAAAGRDDLPKPAADAAAAASSDAADASASADAAGSAPVDASGLTASAPGEVATGVVDVPAEPEAPAAPEGTVAS